MRRGPLEGGLGRDRPPNADGFRQYLVASGRGHHRGSCGRSGCRGGGSRSKHQQGTGRVAATPARTIPGVIAKRRVAAVYVGGYSQNDLMQKQRLVLKHA